MKRTEHPFPFESGNLALDLLNTVRGPVGEVVDGVRAPNHLLAWLDASGLSRVPHLAQTLPTPPVARRLLTEVQRLRNDIERLLVAHRTGEVVAPHVLYGINRVLEAGRASALLSVEESGAWLVELEVGEGPLAVLAPIARAAAELVIATDPARVRRCASHSCLSWFVDTSKGGRRRWCSMATCGNRAKAAKHRQRLVTE